MPILELVFWLPFTPTHLCHRDGCVVITEAHLCLIARTVHFHDQAHQVATWFILVTVPVRVFVVAEFLLCRRTLTVVRRGRDHRVARAPARVCAVILSQTSAHDFISALLCVGIDRCINGETTLRYASCVSVFELLADVLNRIIKRR